MSRITLVLNRPLVPSETFQRALVESLVSGGHQVSVHALRGAAGGAGGGDGLVVRGGPATVARSVAGAPHRALAVAARRATARYGRSAVAARAALLAGPILATRPDVVHAGFSGIAVALAPAWPLLEGVPLVVSCRGSAELVRAALDEQRARELGAVLREAAVVHCVADAVADAVVEMGAARDRIRVIRPAVDLDRWSPTLRPAPAAPWRLVTVGRLVPAKGIDDLLAALAIVREAGIDARLRVIGDGSQAEALRLRIRRTGLDDVVELLGAVAPDAVRAELAAAHLYVSASHSEGISNGVLEAMASGVPVLSTEVGGMAEVIDHGVDGWLVPPGRPDRLASAISAALAEPDRLAAVAAAGRRRVERTGDRRDQTAAWLALYGALESGAAGASRQDQGDEPS